ncbi:MAG: hypothetical protein E7Z77_08435 [Methanobrevibacter sp.]|uniref:hypothetical protein n=1 Tax=Methanobrevibacter sp. TaxID=66852 RepID=UPI0025FD204B|nr:hypothetical protein [Methanobrevibacter sp.]MBE6509423.1 hypothetical protein [Methanobrevibacter sp.]
MILTIFIVSLFAISAVSAEDNATSDAAIMETTIDDDTSVDEISDNEILENANDCGTFNELSDMINNTHEDNTICLEKDYQINQNNTLSIYKPLTIDGKGHTISTANPDVHFSINSKNVAFKNIIFNGNLYLYSCSGSLVNCSFVNVTGGGMTAATLDDLNITKNESASYDRIEEAPEYIIWQWYSYNIILDCWNSDVVNCSFANISIVQSMGKEDYYSARKTIILHSEGNNVVDCSFINISAENNLNPYLLYSYETNVINCSFLNISNCLGINANKVIGSNFSDVSGGSIVSSHGSVVNCSFNNIISANIIPGVGNLTDCIFTNIRQGYLIKGYYIGIDYPNSRIVNCLFENITDSGMDFFSCYDVDFINCSFINLLYGDYFISERWAEWLKVESEKINNDLINCRFVNISIYGTIPFISKFSNTLSKIVNCEFININFFDLSRPAMRFSDEDLDYAETCKLDDGLVKQFLNYSGEWNSEWNWDYLKTYKLKDHSIKYGLMKIGYGNEPTSVCQNCNFINGTFSTLVAPISEIIASNQVVTYSDGSYFYVSVRDIYNLDGFGNKVTFKVSNKQFTSIVNIEYAEFKIDLAPGKYKVTVKGGNITKSAMLTVKHIVSLKTVTVKKSAKKLTLQATLSKINGKYLKNKKVTFKFNGKKYTAKTNNKGVAKLTIKNAKSGKNTYNFAKLKVGKKIIYQATYLKDTVKKTVKIKK